MVAAVGELGHGEDIQAEPVEAVVAVPAVAAVVVVVAVAGRMENTRTSEPC